MREFCAFLLVIFFLGGIVYGMSKGLDALGVKNYSDTIECPAGLKLTYMPGNSNDPYRCLIPVQKKAQ